MRQFVASLRSRLGAEEISALESCLHCRNCGLACAWYLETGEEALHPLHRKRFIHQVYRRFLTPEGRLLGRLGLIPTPTVEDLRQFHAAFWKCSSCGRCSLACPLSISNRSLFRWFRSAYADSGLSHENPTLRSIIENTREMSHSFGVLREKLLLRLGFFLEHQGTQLPLDVPNADYLLVSPAVDTMRFPDQVWKLFQLLNAAGVSYTVSSRVTDLGTEIDHVAGHHGLSQRLLEETEAEADRLRVKALLIPECGCDIRTFYVEAPRLLGRELRVPVISVDTLLLSALRSGQLPFQPLNKSVTLHDPCQVTRLSGMGQTGRDILDLIAPNWVEMDPHGERNYCCNGSSGPLRLPENAPLRRRVSRLKAEQIRQTGAEWVTAPCAVCILSLTDLCQHHGLTKAGERKVYMLYEIMHTALMSAVQLGGREASLHQPALFNRMTPELIHHHSLAGWIAHLRRNSLWHQYAGWLQSDESVQRYCKSAPSAATVLTHWLSYGQTPESLSL